MADNTFVIDPKRSRNANADPTPIATDDITQTGSVAKGAKVQRVKLGIGKDGEYADISTDSPIPVENQNDVPTSSERLLSEMLLQMRFIHQLLAGAFNDGELLTEDDTDIDLSNDERV